jgi:hypothetical protein
MNAKNTTARAVTKPPAVIRKARPSLPLGFALALPLGLLEPDAAALLVAPSVPP